MTGQVAHDKLNELLLLYRDLKEGYPVKCGNVWTTNEKARSQIHELLDEFAASESRRQVIKSEQNRMQCEKQRRDLIRWDLKERSPNDLCDYEGMLEKLEFFEIQAEVHALEAEARKGEQPTRKKIDKLKEKGAQRAKRYTQERKYDKRGYTKKIPEYREAIELEGALINVSMPRTPSKKGQRKNFPHQPISIYTFQLLAGPHTAKEYIQAYGVGEKKMRKFLKRLRDEDSVKYVKGNRGQSILYSQEASERVFREFLPQAPTVGWARPHTSQGLIDACCGGKAKVPVRKFLKRLRDENPKKYIMIERKKATDPVVYSQAASLRVLTELLRNWDKWVLRRHRTKGGDDADRMLYVAEVLYFHNDGHTFSRNLSFVRDAISEGLSLSWHQIEKRMPQLS